MVRDVAQTDCRIYRRHDPDGGWRISLASGRATAVKRWVAMCPVCGEVARDTAWRYYRTDTINTRKTAKDALHRHMRDEHS